MIGTYRRDHCWILFSTLWLDLHRLPPAEPPLLVEELPVLHLDVGDHQAAARRGGGGWRPPLAGKAGEPAQDAADAATEDAVTVGGAAAALMKL